MHLTTVVLGLGQCGNVDLHSATVISSTTAGREWPAAGWCHSRRLVRAVSHPNANDNHVECDGDDRRNLAINNVMSMEKKY